MAASFIPQTDPYTIPAGLTVTQTADGGTAYVDAQGNPYIRGASGFTLSPNVKLASAPMAMNGPQPSPSVTSSSSSSGSASGPTPNSVTVGGQTYTLQNGDQGYGYYFFNGQGGASFMTPSQMQPYIPKAAQPVNNSDIANLPNLVPGSTGDAVKQLQQWLVQNGYMTQAQMNTGPGTYGPQTQAAVAAWQKANNIDTQGNPGYFGPISRSFLANQPSSSPSGGAAGGGSNSSGTPNSGGAPSLTPTGNSSLDSILQNLLQLVQNNQAKIPPGLQITPALTQQFLAWAHQNVDPQTQQLIQSEITNINANLQNMQTQYENSKAQTLQDFGTNLATEQNAAGASGTAFSGLRNLTEANMAASTNRTLASLASDAAFNMGNAARMSAANVGAANAGGITLPSITGATVGITGGSRGSVSAGPSLDFNYNPSLYQVGSIPTAQNTTVGNLAGQYLNTYTNLAGTESGRSMSDLIKQVPNLPAGYQIPSNLT